MRIILDCEIENAATVLEILTDNLEQMAQARDGYGWTMQGQQTVRAFVRRTKSGFSVRQMCLSAPLPSSEPSE